jgi:GxxExxY protein
VLYEDITRQIIGCAMAVHSELGNGFPESIYQKALAEELKLSGLHFEREFQMPVYYQGNRIGTRRVDFFVANKVMVELKAVIALEAAHLTQAINYLEAYTLDVGLLINFGAGSLQWKRLINKKLPR